MNIRLRFIRFKEKLTHWEYWPFEVVYFPVFFYYIFLAAKAKSFFFFSASNPSIPGGGLTGESKGDILDLIPPEWKAITFRVSAGSSLNQWMAAAAPLGYPLIAKPDVGERGTDVKIIHSEEELIQYASPRLHASTLLQEYVSFPLELGLFYYRFPGQPKGVISSLTSKDFLSITGDGMSTTVELLEKNKRALFQYHRQEELLEGKRNYIPLRGEKLVLEPIGNHCRGTTFLNEASNIDERLHQVFDAIAQSIPGFYFGRFDLRCSSWEDLKQGKNIKILELNGAGAEPAHIYQPGFPYRKGIGSLLLHWRILFEISMENHRSGVPFMAYKDWKKLRKR
ncbi:MAG: hypothetical protein MUF42_01015 [Cytophagaceae bacterium]|jgi:hypothetical protein|nr:hypothetical protein [Cytophagaceae bacterium]